MAELTFSLLKDGKHPIYQAMECKGTSIKESGHCITEISAFHFSFGTLMKNNFEFPVSSFKCENGTNLISFLF